MEMAQFELCSLIFLSLRGLMPPSTSSSSSSAFTY